MNKSKEPLFPQTQLMSNLNSDILKSGHLKSTALDYLQWPWKHGRAVQITDSTSTVQSVDKEVQIVCGRYKKWGFETGYIHSN